MGNIFDGRSFYAFVLFRIVMRSIFENSVNHDYNDRRIAFMRFHIVKFEQKVEFLRVCRVSSFLYETVTLWKRHTA